MQYEECKEYAKEGEFVYCNKFPIRITKVIGYGEEGVIYKTDTPYVCKIYKQGSLDELKYIKLTSMLRMNIKDPGICWPLAIVHDVNGDFIGYLMKRAYGQDINEAIFNNNLQSNYSSWTQKDLVQVAITILGKIQYLHNKGVILGDINAENILIVSATEVYFVDTDSYQINGIPCPVGTEIFTAPEIRECVYSKFLRSYGNEYFAVATLIFMIILMGVAPYEGKKSKDVMRNIKTMNFTFPLSYSILSNITNKQGMYIWNGLPYFVREAFYSTFKRGGKRSYEYSRYTTEDWIYIMKKYLEQLEPGLIKGN